MGNAAEFAERQDRSQADQDAVAAQVQAALSEILKSTPFRASKQSQQLLQYIVDQTLAGHIELLKERIIGAEVFGRPPDYDTNGDPIVRARAAEVRKRLAQYYVGEGSHSTVRIEISPGSYHASFGDSAKPHAPHPTEESKEPELEPAHHQAPLPLPPLEPSAQAPHPHPVSAVSLPGKSWWLVAAAVLAILAGAVIYLAQPKDPVKQFWSPLLATSTPVLIYTGANPVYMPSPTLIARYQATHHLSDLDIQGHEFLVPITEDQKLGPGDLLEMKSDFATLGDVSANVNVATLLTRFDRSFDLRSGEDVVFGDLRQSPAVLIGAFNNGWTLQMTGDLPFVFGSGLVITDRSSPGKQWHPTITDGHILFDYALVARLPHSKTGEPLIAIAGVTQSGTRAAAEFITSASALRAMLQTAPKDWPSKNLEFVLATKVVNNIPTNPTVVAIRFW